MVPLALPQRPLPRDIVVDASSAWQSSAVMETAFETAAFASRLVSVSESGTRTLGDLAAELNPQGKQTIARLQLALREASVRDERGGSSEARRRDEDLV